MSESLAEAPPLVVAYGGGTNSAAMLCGFRERGIRPDLILFADTKGERPETYAHIQTMSAMAALWWNLEIITVRKLFQGQHEGLEAECLRKKTLPPLAFGFKTCSQKHKIEPQTGYLKQWMTAQGITEVRRAIGYDAGEVRGSNIKSEDLKKGRTAHNWFPLKEWNWRREDCVAAITRHNLPQPGKSACFFCPATKRHEILALQKSAPDLFARALTIERSAITRESLGLSGRLHWSKVQNTETADLWEWADQHAATRIPCGCCDEAA